jgi:sugar phosphate permease
MDLALTPTRARYKVLWLAFAVAVITYLDRICISVAAPSMMRDLDLTQLQMGFVFGAFALAYGIFEIPTGWWGDRTGQRIMMTRIVAGWSLFTMLTGAAWNYGALVATRFAFGAAEAGAFPTLSRALARWFPPRDMGRASGVMWMGARMGGALAPALAAYLIVRIGWRETFVLFGSIGVVWCVVYWRWFRDDPARHPEVNAAELAYIRLDRAEKAEDSHDEPAPWGRIFGSVNMWALFVMYFTSAYGVYFFITWMPTYLMEDHGLTLQRSGIYAAMPLAAGAVGCLAGGTFSDWLVRRLGSLKWGRRAVGIGGYALTSVAFMLATSSSTPFTAVLWFTVAHGIHDLTLPVSWATCLSVGGRHGGTATGFMNTASSISAMLSPVSAAWLSKRYGSFDIMLWAAAGLYMLGALMWFRIDPTETISED